MRGRLVRYSSADPAAGADIAPFAVPAGKRWRLLQAFALLTTDANAANRLVHLVLDDGATVYGTWGATPAINIIASTNYRITFSPQSGGAGGLQGPFGGGVNDAYTVSIPLLELPPGHRLFTATRNIQVGDNYGPLELLVEEWDA